LHTAASRAPINFKLAASHQTVSNTSRLDTALSGTFHVKHPFRKTQPAPALLAIELEKAIPLAAPVITATLPLSLSISGFPLA
jgi:hypothetical protein